MPTALSARECACGCGLPVSPTSTWRRGHSPGSKMIGTRPKSAEHRAKLSESLRHGAARLGAMKVQLDALLARDSSAVHLREIIERVKQAEATGQDAVAAVMTGR